MQDEFYAIAFRKKPYGSLEELRKILVVPKSLSLYLVFSPDSRLTSRTKPGSISVLMGLFS
jgi:hypothetical protein